MMKSFVGLAMLAMVGCGGVGESPSSASRVERQMIGLLEKFDRWDYNGNGYLELSELGETEALTGIEPQRVMDFYDINRDGRISMAEAQAGTERVGEAQARVAEQR